MKNFFANRLGHTAEPERKYGLFALSYLATGLAATVAWLGLLFFTPLNRLLNVEGSEERPFLYLLIAFVALSLWIFTGHKRAIFRRPRRLPLKLIMLVGVACFGLWAWYFMQASRFHTFKDTLLAAGLIFIPPLVFLNAPVFFMVLIEELKESQFYQETLIEGRGHESNRFGGLLTYKKNDITEWYSRSWGKIQDGKHSPVFVGRTMWQYDYKIGGRDIGLTSEQHLITVAGTGSGKSRDMLYHSMLAHNAGIIGFDTKGELARTCVDRRRPYAPFQCLDPYGKSGLAFTHHWNPLSEIDPDSPTARADLKRLAAAITPKEKGERAVDVHFREIPQQIVRGYLAHILTEYPEEQRHLGTFFDLFVMGAIDGEGFNPEAVQAVIDDMAKNNAMGGAPAQAAAALAVLSDRDRSAHYTTIGRSLDWVADPSMRPMITNTNKGGVHLRSVKTQDASVFIVIPEKYLEEQSRFLRLFYTLAFDVLDEHETKQKEGSEKRCLFVFDEFEVMGTFEPARQAALRKRSSFIKCHFIVQNFDQFNDNYSNLQDFFGNCDKQFFGIDRTDTEIRKIISNALGQYSTKENGENVSKPVMSESALTKVLNPDRMSQLIIPVKGYPLRLRRVHFERWYGSKFHKKNAKREERRKQKRTDRAIKSVERMGGVLSDEKQAKKDAAERRRQQRRNDRSVKAVNRMGGYGIGQYLFGEYGLLTKTEYTPIDDYTPEPAKEVEAVAEAAPVAVKEPVEKIVTPTIAETIKNIEAASEAFTKAWTPRADMSAKERADLIGFRYIHGFLPSVEETGKNLAPIMLAERLTLEGSVVTQMILLRETLKDAEAWFIFKKIPYAASDMALLHEGVNSIYARNK